MRSNKPNTFLLGHARRMRAYRMRQRQQDPDGYRKHIAEQRRNHRLRTQNDLLKTPQPNTRHPSTTQKRKSDRERKRRSRNNQTNDMKDAERESNRKYKSQRSKATTLIDPLQKTNDKTHNIIHPVNNNLEHVTPYHYTVSILLN
ncbi:unnamed protein product [Adineta ricciae]|uniref:Uncharacterized protein n=1 Tax=Adineta ricciae TaxID=249248 RepID=A0A815RNE9_ADIRI|nr:unnamed protein product [Adineta ricciae]CAF1480551.1 unnamed protein product [Adineta ricciae]